MPQNTCPNVVILSVVLSFFALSFATSVESAQTSKKPNKATPQTSSKKTSKSTPTPNKKAQAKATPAPPKKSDKSTAKTKAADKKTSDKTSAKITPKGKTPAKTKEVASKQAKPTKSSQKTPDKKTAAASKPTKTDSKSSPKNASSKTAAKNSKPVTIAKNVSAPSKNAAPRKSTPEAASSKTSPKTPVKSVEKDSDGAPQIIVTDISARIRSQAKAGAPEVTQAKLGTIFQVSEKTPAWYRVQFSSGAKTTSGWISANSVNDVNSAGKDQLYRQIADRYYKAEGMDFATASELYDFLNRAAGDIGGSGSAEIELKKLLALRQALKGIPTGKGEQSPYREFIKAHEKSVVYSDPSAEWMVSSNLFWDLHKKHAKSPLADQIAWEGAQNPLPGECEGYVNCYLFYVRMTVGEYLSLHPTGKRSLEALTDLTNSLEPIAASLPDKTTYTGPSDVTDRAEFNSLIAELRTIISRLPLAEKEKPLQQLKKIAEGFR